MTHFIKKCICGKTIAQCRCPDFNKTVEIIKPCVHQGKAEEQKCNICLHNEYIDWCPCSCHARQQKPSPSVSEQKEYKADCIYMNEDCPICPRSLYQSNDTEKPATISTEEHSGSLSNQTDKKVDKESVIKPELDSVSVKEGWKKELRKEIERDYADDALTWGLEDHPLLGENTLFEDRMKLPNYARTVKTYTDGVLKLISKQIAQTEKETQEAFVKMIDRHLEKRHLSDSLKLNMIRMDLESIKSKYIHTEERSTNNTE